MPHDLALVCCGRLLPSPNMPGDSVTPAIRSAPRGRKQKERLRSHAGSTMLCSGACPRSCTGEAQYKSQPPRS